MVKIKSIDIGGIRGIRGHLPLELNGKSVLVFGENGAGKSSLTDAIEWYYSDGIEHLASEEIDSTKGRGALRNLFIPDNEEAYIAIQYSNNALDSKKSINNVFKAANSNNSDDFKEFISSSQSEKLVFRYRDLVKFIIAPKAEKLKTLQEIIGYAEVSNLRDLLKKTAVRIAKNIKLANYDNQKNAQQSIILGYLSQNAYTDIQLFEGANKLIEPLKISKKIVSFEDIEEVLRTIETKEDTALFERISFLTRIAESLGEIAGNVDTINQNYQSYYLNYTNLLKDAGKITKLQLLTLLKEGRTVLINDVIQDNCCPLCQQEKNKVELITQLDERINELEALEQEKSDLDEQGQELAGILATNINIIVGLLKDKHCREKENTKLVEKIEEIQTSLETLSAEQKKDVNSKIAIQEFSSVGIEKEGISAQADKALGAAAELTAGSKTNIQFQIYTKLAQSIAAYNQYHEIERKQNTLMKQQSTFEVLSAEFIKRQEAALNAFLTLFSTEINDYYTAMNPTEKIEDIKLVVLKDKNDDLNGITIGYRFYDKDKKAPSAYLSESHINCLGLSFLLASVRAFNKNNRFFVLDDVISSFDKSHRARFAKLLIDKFGDYQILLLTHEKEFFDLLASDVKSRGWLISNFEWSNDQGTYLDEAILDSKDRILKKFQDKNIDGLGNDIRIYTEKVMKDIACNIEAPVAFKYNEINEKRMAAELLNAVHSRISKKGSALADQANIPQLTGMSLFIGNITSHDNDFSVNIHDLGVMWEGISTTINIFYCDDCKTFISTKYLDNVANKIRCSCGNLSYDWKKS